MSHLRSAPTSASSSAMIPPSIHTTSDSHSSLRKPHSQTQTYSANVAPKAKKVIGDWILTKTLGEGSMGKVKLAIHQVTGEKRACKIISISNISPAMIGPTTSIRDLPAAAKIPSSQATQLPKSRRKSGQMSKEARIIREAAIMLLLDHPHIVTLHDILLIDNYYYLFFEFVNGGQMLDFIISHGKMKEKAARKFFRQIVGAVDFCHQNSIVHRDLKIENILIDKNGAIKIIDFGLSNLFSTQSMLSTFCGSLYFAAPELLSAKSYMGPEVDIWSLGVILFVLVCGHVPFDDANMSVLHAKIKAGIVEYPHYLSSECKNMIQSMLQIHPPNRATMDDIKYHPWLLKGYDGPPDNYLPVRSKIELPLNMQVITRMKGFGFGTDEEIVAEMEEYIVKHNFAKSMSFAEGTKLVTSTSVATEGGNPSKSFFKSSSFSPQKFDLQKVGLKMHSGKGDKTRRTLPENPIVSIYYLVAEKMEREMALKAAVALKPAKEDEVDIRSSTESRPPELDEAPSSDEDLVPVHLRDQKAYTEPSSPAESAEDIRISDEEQEPGPQKVRARASSAGELHPPTIKQFKEFVGRQRKRKIRLPKRKKKRRNRASKRQGRHDGSGDGSDSGPRNKGWSEGEIDQLPSTGGPSIASNFVSAFKKLGRSAFGTKSKSSPDGLGDEDAVEGEEVDPALSSGKEPVKKKNTKRKLRRVFQREKGDGSKHSHKEGNSTDYLYGSSPPTIQPLASSPPASMKLSVTPPSGSGSLTEQTSPSSQHFQIPNDGPLRRDSFAKNIFHKRLSLAGHLREGKSGQNAAGDLVESPDYTPGTSEHNVYSPLVRSHPNLVDDVSTPQKSLSGNISYGRADKKIKSVYLKGLFSVKNSSSKRAALIRTDLIRVFDTLHIHYEEWDGFFKCRFQQKVIIGTPKNLSPVKKKSDLLEEEAYKHVKDSSESSQPDFMEGGEPVGGELSKSPLRIAKLESFAKSDHELGGKKSAPQSPLAEESEKPLPKTPTVKTDDPGTPTLHKEIELVLPEGFDLVTRQVIFDVYIVKIGWLGLHGVQFRRIGGDSWQASKCGTLPAEIDPITGREINPHIPRFISQAPWYLDTGNPTLLHQRRGGEKESDFKWYERGKTKGPAATKYRKGACENCGAMTHKTKDCLERPRKLGAKWTGSGIKEDEVIQDVSLGFEAKRDRWNGYNPADHKQTIEEFELVEMERKKLREAEAKIKLESGEMTKKDSDDEDEDEFKYAEGANVPGQRVDHLSRTTVRNLRIREDTAKYLLNLDVDSAYYDPKTRSMRDDPLKNKDKPDVQFAGDNFVRYTGDTKKMAELQIFAWEASSHNADVHLQANPSQAELLYKEHLKKKSEYKNVHKDSILAKYGGEEHLKAPPKELLMAQTENYVEYSQTGRVIKGQERAAIKSRYEEDNHPLNHTAIWGSYWVNGQWGYKCCHAMLKNAYCTGESGKEAARASAQMMEEKMEKLKTQALTAKPSDALALGKRRLGEGEVELDKSKLEKAREEERKRKKQDQKGRYNASADTGGSGYTVTEEELEAYRLEKNLAEDPMAHYKDEEE